MKHFVISSGVIENIIECDEGFDPGQGKSLLSAEGVTGSIGWSVVNDQPVAPTVTPPAGTAEKVKREAYRRIIAICPKWKQRNLLAQASLLNDKGRANWTSGELAAWNAGQAIWTQIKAIRDASDTIEAMDPIPSDFDSDEYWT